MILRERDKCITKKKTGKRPISKTQPTHIHLNYASYPEESSRNPTKKPDVTYENPQTKKNDIRDAVLHNKKKIHNNSSG